jgi:hypothetical protein
MEPVTIGTRATKDPETGKARVIDATNRTRSILIPCLQVPDVPSRFTMFVLDALRKVAKAQLSALWEETPTLKEVSPAIWSVDALLMFAAREAESKRLSKDTVTAWFESSHLAILLATKDAKVAASWKARIIGLAAPSITLNTAECDKTIAAIAKNDDDAQSMIGAQLIAKLAARVKAMQVQEVELEDLE